MDNEEYLDSLVEYLKHIKNIERIDFLPYHTLGKEKYKELNIKYPYEHLESMDSIKCQELYNKFINEVNEIKTYQLNIGNKLDNVDNRLKVVENKITEYDLPLEKIIYNGEYYDAYTLIQTIFESASSEVIIETSFYY